MDVNTSPLQEPDSTTPDHAAARQLLAEICEMFSPGLSAELRWSSDAQGVGA